MTKTIIIFFTLTILFVGRILGQEIECGDSITYSNAQQTKYDKRLSDYPKIESVPSYNDGKDKLNKLIESSLKLDEEAKNVVFRLNYMFTVTCQGEIKDFKTLGDPKVKAWTNMGDIIEGTTGKWTPAEKDGSPVDCIYFARKTIVGNKY